MALCKLSLTMQWGAVYNLHGCLQLLDRLSVCPLLEQLLAVRVQDPSAILVFLVARWAPRLRPRATQRGN